MGKLEESVKAEIRRTKVNRAIIDTIAASGMIALALVAPGVIAALGKIKFLPQRRYQAKKALTQMIEKGYVRVESKGGTSFVRLTEKGERLAALMDAGRIKLKKPARWDGKWRMLIFDIPEGRRAVRTQIRSALIRFGFVRLQDSVWVFPYDCEDLILILKAELKIGKDVLYVIADRIEYDAPFRKMFGL